MGNRSHYRSLTFFIAGALTFIICAVTSSQIASAQTRIISLSGDLDFGSIPLRSSAQRTLTISNAGDSVLTIRTLYYPPEPAFVAVDLEGNFSGPIAPGASQDVVITFTPLGTAINGGTNDLYLQGYLWVDSDATGGTNTIPMSGVGTWPPATRSLSLTTNLDFGNVPIGTTTSLMLSLTNTGNAPLTISNIAFPDGFSSGFTSGTIDAGTGTNIFVLFRPSVVTNYGGLAAVSSDTTDPVLVLVTYGGNFTNSLLGTTLFGVSGTGVYPSGKFNGLFMPTNDPAFENSGYFTAESTAKGKLRATLTLAGKRYPFSAQISPSGVASATITREKLPALNVSLQFGVGFYSRDWTGTIDDGTWTAQLLAEPAPLLSRNSPRLVPPGKYTITIAGSTNSSVGPTAPGTGTLDIRVSNATRVTGTLGDGTQFSQNTILCNAQLPLYAPLYGNRGAVMGWIGFGAGLRPPPPGSFPGFPPPTVIEVPRQTNPPVAIPPIGGVEIIRLQPPTISPVEMLPPAYAPIEIQPQRLTGIQLQMFGELHWFKPAGIDRDYPDGFSFQTTATGLVP